MLMFEHEQSERERERLERERKVDPKTHDANVREVFAESWLPSPPNDYIANKDLEEALRRAIAAPLTFNERVLVLTGPHGIGKSSAVPVVVRQLQKADLLGPVLYLKDTAAVRKFAGAHTPTASGSVVSLIDALGSSLGRVVAKDSDHKKPHIVIVDDSQRLVTDDDTFLQELCRKVSRHAVVLLVLSDEAAVQKMWQLSHVGARIRVTFARPSTTISDAELKQWAERVYKMPPDVAAKAAEHFGAVFTLYGGIETAADVDEVLNRRRIGIQNMLAKTAEEKPKRANQMRRLLRTALAAQGQPFPQDGEAIPAEEALCRVKALTPASTVEMTVHDRLSMLALQQLEKAGKLKESGE